MRIPNVIHDNLVVARRLLDQRSAKMADHFEKLGFQCIRCFRGHDCGIQSQIM